MDTILFIILAGKPYYVTHGTVCPVTIDKNSVEIHTEDAEPYAGPGIYTLTEVHAKLGSNATSKKKSRRKRTEEQ